MTSKERQKDYRLRKRYGITLADYKRMLKEQKNGCAICGKPNKNCKRGLQVDHTHQTGYVRGLLCLYCNRKIVGNSAEDYLRVKGLIKYLQDAVKGDTKWQEISAKRRALAAKRKKS